MTFLYTMYQDACTLGHGLVVMVVLGWWLGFSSLNEYIAVAHDRHTEIQWGHFYPFLWVQSVIKMYSDSDN